MEVPELHGYEKVIADLQEIGFVRSGMNGSVALNHGDIKDWLDVTRRNVGPRMCQLIISLSRSYCNQSNISRDHVAAPWGGEEYANSVAQVRVDVKTRKALRNRNG